MRFDLHTHSQYSSDGYLTPQIIVKICLRRGLSGVAVTDHNTIKGGQETSKYVNQESKNLKEEFKVIIGSEISSTQGEIIGLFLNEEIKSKEPLEVMDEIRDQDGIVVIPHPFDNIRGESFTPQKEHLKLIHKIEVFNSRCVRSKFNRMAKEFASEHGLGLSAGSDAHFANELGKAGIEIGKQDKSNHGQSDIDIEKMDIDRDIENINIREIILKNEYQVFGQKSSVINHGFTKVLKIWRKARYG